MTSDFDINNSSIYVDYQSKSLTTIGNDANIKQIPTHAYKPLKNERRISMDRILKYRPNSETNTLYLSINRYLGGSVNKTEVFNMGIDIALKGTVEDLKKASRLKVKQVPSDEKIPDFSQIRTTEEEYKEISDKIKEAFKPLQRVTTPYLVKIVLKRLLMYLEKTEENASSVEKIAVVEEVTGIEEKQDNVNSEEDTTNEQISDFESMSIDEKLNCIFKRLLQIERNCAHE